MPFWALGRQREFVLKTDNRPNLMTLNESAAVIRGKGSHLDNSPIPDNGAALVHLITQAEALLGACRVLVRQSEWQLHSPGLNLQPFHLGREGPSSETAARRSRKKPARPQVDKTTDLIKIPTSLPLDIGFLEALRRAFPKIGKGSLRVFCILLENAGVIVGGKTLQTALQTNSKRALAVYICRLRVALANRGIEAPIITSNGGYGLTSEAAAKISDILKQPQPGCVHEIDDA